MTRGYLLVRLSTAGRARNAKIRHGAGAEEFWPLIAAKGPLLGSGKALESAHQITMVSGQRTEEGQRHRRSEGIVLE